MILKIRGSDDFEKFVERIEKCDENEEILVILERIRHKKSSGRALSVISAYHFLENRIFPSELQRGKYVGNGAHATVRM